MKVFRSTAIHESGHAVLALVGCRAVYGNDGAFYFIEVRARGDHTPIQTRRNLIHANGIVYGCELWREEGEFGYISRIYDDYDRCAIRAIAQSRMYMAGPIAHAKVSRRSLNDVLWTNGYADCEKAMNCLWDCVDTEEEAADLYQRVEDETKQLVGQHWWAVEALADRLQIQHRLELEEALPIITGIGGEIS